MKFAGEKWQPGEDGDIGSAFAIVVVTPIVLWTTPWWFGIPFAMLMILPQLKDAA